MQTDGEVSTWFFSPSYGSHFKIMISKLIINRINVNFSIKRMRIGFCNSARAAITPEIDLQLPAYSFLIAWSLVNIAKSKWRGWNKNSKLNKIICKNKYTIMQNESEKLLNYISWGNICYKVSNMSLHCRPVGDCTIVIKWMVCFGDVGIVFLKHSFQEFNSKRK